MEDEDDCPSDAREAIEDISNRGVRASKAKILEWTTTGQQQQTNGCDAGTEHCGIGTGGRVCSTDGLRIRMRYDDGNDDSMIVTDDPV